MQPGKRSRNWPASWKTDVQEFDLPAEFDQAHELHRIVMEADLARSFEPEYRDGRDQLSDILAAMIERGQKVLAVDYNNAVASADELYGSLDKLFECHDAIITPATIGEAPIGLESTGSPIFCTIWTFCGMPSISLPLLRRGERLAAWRSACRTKRR